MKKEKLLILVILILVLINSATLLMMWINRPPHPPKHGHGPHQRPDKMIIEKLKLDETQQEKFSELKEEHHSNMVKIDEQLKEVRKNYYGLLKDNSKNILEKDSLENSCAQLSRQKEQFTFDHFEKLKALCKPNQLEDFYKLTEELSEIFSRPPMPPYDR